MMRIGLGETLDNLVMFVGTTPNIGTTAIAYRTAAALAVGAPKSRIAYLCLNLKSSKIARYLGIHDPHAELSMLRAELKARSLTAARLEKLCLRAKPLANLFVLCGNMQRAQAELFAPEDLEHLLMVAGEAYDLCIVDCSAYWDNAATVVSGMHAKVKLLVTQPKLDAFQDDYHGWITNTAAMFGIDPREFALILAQTGQSADEYRAGEIQQATGLPMIASIPYDKQLITDMQQGRLQSWQLTNRAAARAIHPVCRYIAKRTGIDWASSEAPRSLLGIRMRRWKQAAEQAVGKP